MAARHGRGSAAARRAASELEGPSSRSSADRPSLRLAASRGALGIELDGSFKVGPLRLTSLSIRLPSVRFPVDLSGGVMRFRHKRGELDGLTFEASAVELSKFCAPRLRGFSQEGAPSLVISPLDGGGALVAFADGKSALAFDVALAPVENGLWLIPECARGIGLGAPAHVLAMRVLGALAVPFGRLERGRITIEDPAGILARTALPLAGARVPSRRGLRWSTPETHDLCFSVSARRGESAETYSDRSRRALETVELSGIADSKAFAGEFEEARQLYLGLLERAPQHPEIARRLASIDASIGDRPEAALATLVEVVPAIQAGILGGELLATVGDHDGAYASLAHGAEVEPFGPLAALAWLRAAELAGAEELRESALDRAVVRAPALQAARWARLEARLDRTNLIGARADAEHLEAATSGSASKHAICLRAANAFLARGFVPDATSLFERALRYAPEDPIVLGGLARALRKAGQRRRALDVVARAVAMAARKDSEAHTLTLEYARDLAEITEDRPSAIARVRLVPDSAAESFEARLLEARWRAELGDLGGAAVALGRLREAVALAGPVGADLAASWAALLTQAATIDERDRGDLASAQRSLGLAMGLMPRNRTIASEFRRVAALVTKQGPTAPNDKMSPEQHAPVTTAPYVPSTSVAALFDDGDEERGAVDEREIERWTERVRSNPDDDAAVLSLADLLTRAGRDLELVALLSGRIDEGSKGQLDELLALRRQALRRLAESASLQGRVDEAAMYRSMADDSAT